MKLIIVFLLLPFAVMPQQRRFEITDRQIDAGDYFPVIEPVVWSVSIYDGPKKYEKDLARFSKQQRHVFACHWYLSEVNNGGHDQFYDNSTGIVWKDARDGFIAIGVREVATIIDQSALRLGGKPSLDRDERQQQLERIDKRFDDLDKRLFQLEKKVDLDKKLIQFIRTNRRHFYFSGSVKTP